MTIAQARKKISDAIEKESYVAVAYVLKCSTTQILSVASGKRNPGLRIALAIQRHFQIPVEVWVEEET